MIPTVELQTFMVNAFNVEEALTFGSHHMLKKTDFAGTRIRAVEVLRNCERNEVTIHFTDGLTWVFVSGVKACTPLTSGISKSAR